MARHQGSKEIAKKKGPKQTFSLITLGTRTKGWDKNPPPKDCPYGTYGKRMQRSVMGFGSLATAIYSRGLVTEVILNESHGTLNPGKSNMRYFHQRLESHKENRTTEYKTMRRAVAILFQEFPDIKDNVSQADQDAAPLIKKIRKIMKGAHAARNADANIIRRDILILAHDDVKRRGWSVPPVIDKNDRGIKSEFTARLLLPLKERLKYLDNPGVYRKQVEEGQINVSLSGTWSAILYDESMIEAGNELAGLLRSETLLRIGITILCSPSAGRKWEYLELDARSYAASQKESNAEINGIKEITPEAIAYFSTLAVFAVHEGSYFSRELGGIDLSEVYHDVVGVLRIDTEWSVETLKFWNQIFFGKRQHEEEEPKINREDRFRRLQAEQREREGRAQVGPGPSTSTAPTVTPPTRNQRPARGPDNMESEDQTNAGKSQGGSRSHQPISQTKGSPPRPKNKQKRKIIDSDDEPSYPSDLDEDGLTESQSATPRPQAKKKRVTTPLAQSPDHISHDSWVPVSADLSRLATHAMNAGLEATATEFFKIVAMGEDEGVQYYNDNFDRIEWLKADTRRKRNTPSAGGSQNAVPAPKIPPARGRAPPKGKKATKTPHTELMLPPRITRSQALNQSPHPQDKDDDEPDPLSDLEGPAIPGSSTRHR